MKKDIQNTGGEPIVRRGDVLGRGQTCWHSFQVCGLKDRRLFTFNGVSALLMSGEQKSTADAYENFVAVPVSAQPATLGPFEAKIIRPLFAFFNGYSMSDDEIERRIAAYLSRKSR